MGLLVQLCMVWGDNKGIHCESDDVEAVGGENGQMCWDGVTKERGKWDSVLN